MYLGVFNNIHSFGYHLSIKESFSFLVHFSLQLPRKSGSSWLFFSESFWFEIRRTVTHPDSSRINLLLVFNFFWISLITYWSNVTDSLGKNM